MIVSLIWSQFTVLVSVRPVFRCSTEFLSSHLFVFLEMKNTQLFSSVVGFCCLGPNSVRIQSRDPEIPEP